MSWRYYLPYAVGIGRWLIFILLKAVPATLYRPYTSRTLERDIKRHELLMRRGFYLCVRTGTFSGLGGGLLGFGLANLVAWLTDKATYVATSAGEIIVQSLVLGFIPGFLFFFAFAAFIEDLNIRVRRKFMKDISVHRTNGNTDDEWDSLVEPAPFTPSDVTVVIPVYQPPAAFKANMASLIENGPAKIYIVADITCADEMEAIVKTLDCSHDQVEVISEPLPGKRAALSSGLRVVQTRLTCFVDDDCQWCDSTYLPNLIKPFNNRTIGGVGSRQIMRPSEKYPTEDGGDPIVRKKNILEVMADFRLATRYIDLMATTTVDRGASCISGRTMCFRTEAIKEEFFHDAFMHETLWGTHLLSGDDKFLTRYIVKKAYKTYHQLQAVYQCDPGCVLTTTFESRPEKHLRQLVRWSRNTWRSDITALFIERKIWLHSPFTAFLLFDKLFSPFFLMYGLFLIPIFTILRSDWRVFVGWIAWLHVSRALKLVLHFKRLPGDIVYLPIWIVYQYLMTFIRTYAMFTMTKTHWGNRDVAVVGNEVKRTRISPKVGMLAYKSEPEENGSSEESSSQYQDDMSREEQAFGTRDDESLYAYNFHPEQKVAPNNDSTLAFGTGDEESLHAYNSHPEQKVVARNNDSTRAFPSSSLPCRTPSWDTESGSGGMIGLDADYNYRDAYKYVDVSKPVVSGTLASKSATTGQSTVCNEIAETSRGKLGFLIHETSEEECPAVQEVIHETSEEECPAVQEVKVTSPNLWCGITCTP